MKRRASLMVASAYGIAPREVALNSLLCCFVTCTAHSKLQLCGFRLVTSIVAHVSTTKQTTAGTSFRHRLCTDAHHTIAHAHICAPVQAKGCMHNGGGGAPSSAESHVRFYLALFLAQFSKHLWLLLQISQQQRQCGGTGVMSSKQQIEGNILHTEQELISALPSVHGKQDCLQPILTLASGFMPEVTFRSAQQVQDGLAIKASISIGVGNLGGERRGEGGF